MSFIYHIVSIIVLFLIPNITVGTAFSMSNQHPASTSTFTSSTTTSTTTSSTTSTGNTDRRILLLPEEDMRFGKFLIPKASIFAHTTLSAAFVNLRPIVPGHVLIMSQRIVPHLADLTQEEYADLWVLVRTVQAMLQKQYNATAFNVAVQDGKAAGQSVPHVHVHILPRQDGDFTRNDDVYEALEEWTPRTDTVKERTDINVPDDEDRIDRTPQMMADEAATYRRLLGAETHIYNDNGR
jgi:bis(5'-adenosyl)-triphosphatase